MKLLHIEWATSATFLFNAHVILCNCLMVINKYVCMVCQWEILCLKEYSLDFHLKPIYSIRNLLLSALFDFICTQIMLPLMMLLLHFSPYFFTLSLSFWVFEWCLISMQQKKDNIKKKSLLKTVALFFLTTVCECSFKWKMRDGHKKHLMQSF